MNEVYRTQHKARYSHMPWLYFSCKEREKEWSRAWQKEVQDHLTLLETVHLSDEVFIAPSARIFAEPGRDIFIGERSWAAADVFMHGPIRLGKDCSVNVRAHLDGGGAGIHCGDHVRIAHGVSIVAFNHGMERGRSIGEQAVTSRGIHIHDDVWIGAKAGITDGVTLGEGCVVGMGAVVTRDVEPYAKVAGVPARVIGRR